MAPGAERLCPRSPAARARATGALPPRPGRRWASGRKRFKKTEPATGVRAPDGRWVTSPPAVDD
eukprot:2073787-Alexandrium_andersonii.AAC.1